MRVSRNPSVSVLLALMLCGACVESFESPEKAPPSASQPAPFVAADDPAPVPTPAPAQPPAERFQGPLLFASVAAERDLAPDSEIDAGVKLELSEPTTVLVVFDKSGSMDAPWAGGETRWVAANKALIAALSPVRAQLTVGAILFPLPGECAVKEIDEAGQYPFMSGTEFIDTWTATIRTNASSGLTPLELALATADKAIAGAGALLEQRFMVLVITDGEPTCQDDLAQLERLPAAWLERGIQTHVMGLPGSEGAAALLDRVAIAGGSAQHVAIGTPDQLQSELSALL